LAISRKKKPIKLPFYAKICCRKNKWEESGHIAILIFRKGCKIFDLGTKLLVHHFENAHESREM